MKPRLRLNPNAVTGLKYGLLFGVPFGELCMFTVGPGDDWIDALSVVVVALFMGLGLTFHFTVIAPVFRRWPFLLNVLGAGVSLGLTIVLSIGAGAWLLGSAARGVSPFSRQVISEVAQSLLSSSLATTVAVTLAGILVMLFFLELSRKLGPGTLRNWLLGRYRRPRVESRVFMFLDLKDSTTLAERLGNEKFSALVRDFFDDLTYPVMSTRGAVSHYIGDEAVLTWPIRLGVKDANCVRCFFLMREAIEERANYYRREYGLVPGFKAGVHLGEAVVTEVGQIKTEIVYHGDVLNTTARITGLCGELGEDLLVSAELAAGLEMGDAYESISLGEHKLKGKAQGVEVVALRPVARAGAQAVLSPAES